MGGARVLLLEDDPMLCRFVQMALEELPITLLVRGTVREALELLQREPVGLIISDLMLPGESGLVLLQRLRDAPALCAGARTAIYSAGITPEVRRQLEGLGAWRILHKPVPMADLCRCVTEGLASGAHAPGPASLEESAGLAVQGVGDADESAAIGEYFAGDVALFRAYRATCVQQFPHDVEAARVALQRQDLAAVGRLAHSLKTVLRSLGSTEAGAIALRVEQCAMHGDWPGTLAHWPALEAALRAQA